MALNQQIGVGAPPAPETWARVTPAGLYIEPGDFYVDPIRGVDRAVITHGHADHARGGHRHALATAATQAIMAARLGAAAPLQPQALRHGETVRHGEAEIALVPAGHVLGSAQVVLSYRGSRIVVSGDYKRSADPTCSPFEPVRCDAFVTEATFGLPVFRHPDPVGEVAKLLAARNRNPDRCVLIGAYALGKAQRLIALIRAVGYDRPIYIHGALVAMVALYRQMGVDLGEIRPAAGVVKAELQGEIVIAPPSALADRWSRKLPDPITAMASGWMRVRQRAKQGGIELPLIISDHADWDELIQTITDVGAERIWVTHGREEALVHQATRMGRQARALALVGREDEGGE
jgi:putative mRNA 3-end processing factor